ncbi:MAG TPA: hypothetical protein ENH86_00420 [Candidatus Jorgensenbacteria bacterium]|uniref:Uncharacterized protein n=1 Tax=marine sediment metagenome TaxID=412755 RepID=A0A0F9K2Q6_9ZZZZ|nr:hypothetical protein [Candidatus Jorgensenbacteria bacterium]
MVTVPLVTNELLSKYFTYQKPIRKTLDPKYKVLTKDGLVIRLQKDHKRLLAESEERIRKAKEKVSEEHKNQEQKIS